MTVHWSHTAIAHLVSIHQYISRDSALYAQQTVDRLISRVEIISEYPRSGRRVPEYRSQDIREVIANPYRIIYQVRESYVEILAVVHIRQTLRLDE